MVGGIKLNARQSVRDYGAPGVPIGIEVPDDDVDLEDIDLTTGRGGWRQPTVTADEPHSFGQVVTPDEPSTKMSDLREFPGMTGQPVHILGATLDPEAHAERLSEAVWPSESLPDSSAVEDALRVWVEVTALTIRTIEAAK